MTRYNRNFFHSIEARAQTSARYTVPILMELLAPSTIIDVGCGTGAWLREFHERGAKIIRGIDGDYVHREDLLIPADCFSPWNLQQQLRVNGRFDLAVSLEVGEHLSANAAEPFVDSLCALAPIVAFSAAIPGQGGISHINEQLPEYWAELFAQCRYVAVDCIRPRIWNDRRIAWYYRQNLILFVHEDELASRPILQQELEACKGRPLSVVHPEMYSGLLFASDPENIKVMDAARRFVASLGASMRRRFGAKGVQ
jgi:hypothetical protein